MSEISDNLYIADLPAEVDDNVVRTVFGAYGQIMSCRAMPGKFPGQKGAALVRFATAEEAAWVVENLNGNIAEGLLEPVKVRFANNKQGGGGGGGANGGGAVDAYGKLSVPQLGGGGGNRSAPWSGGGGGSALAGTEQPSDNVYIADLPGDVDEQLVKSIFSGYGTVLSCKAMQSKYAGQKGAALVRFGSTEEATWVVQNLNGNIAEGLEEPVKVRFANNGSKGGGKGAGAGAGGYGTAGGDAGGHGGGGGGKGDGKGLGKPGSFSNSDMQQVVGALIKQLPGSGTKPAENCLYIEGLPLNTTDLDLYRLFSPFGSIPVTGVKAKVVADGSCSGVGWVDFNDAAAAQAAMEALNDLVLPDGTVLKVRGKRPKGQGPGQGPSQEV